MGGGRRRRRLGWLVAAGLVLAACGTPFGIYHKVLPGQTLYRIGETYNVPVDKIIRLNRIQDPTTLKAGDMVFIPGADRPREVPVTAGRAPAPAAGGKSGSSSSRSTSGGERVRLDDKKSTAADKPRSTWAGGEAPALIWPVQGTVTSGYGKRDGVQHDGVDISAAEGTKILAAAGGRVIYSGDELSGYGNLVIVRHEGSWATVYAHNRKNLVQKGDFVTQGQEVAEVGDTGRASAPHLHFEVRFGKSPKNPLDYLP